MPELPLCHTCGRHHPVIAEDTATEIVRLNQIIESRLGSIRQDVQTVVNVLGRLVTIFADLGDHSSARGASKNRGQFEAIQLLAETLEAQRQYMTSQTPHEDTLDQPHDG